MNRIVFAAATVAVLTAATGAQAHFQLVYTPDVTVAKAGVLPFKLIFWHPFENGPAMDMAMPQSFFVIHKGQKTDLTSGLKPIVFQGAENKAQGFEASVPVKGNGDYIVVLTPAPYWEATESHYVQQITKTYVNKAGLPTDWNKPVGLPTEILPLTKPAAIPTGSTFTGQVLAEGKPAAGIGVEVEYMASEPDMAADKPGPVKASPMRGGQLIVTADANGVFTFGLPKAGFWGFAAIASGPAKEFQGKTMEQDAVIWVHADDMK